MRFTCVDAFSGAGGLSLGLAQAGFEILYSFDNDQKSIETQKINKKYFKHPAEQLDIRELDSKKLLKRLGLRKGDLTLFAGGPPCQGFSIQRIGNDDDDRNNLVFIYMEKVIELSPKFFLLENVPGIAGKRGSEILNQALQIASENGYYIHKQILDAQNFGVPQRRKRLFVIGEKKFNKQKFKFPSKVSKLKTVRDAIFNLPEPPSDGKDHPDFVHHRRDKLSQINLDRIKSLSQGQGMDHLPEHLLANCHKIGASKIGHRNVYGRMDWDKVAPTITARFDSFTRGLFGHPEQNRSISLREGALLQSFPKDFVFSGNKVDIARQIGNAIPPTLAYIIGKQIINAT